MITKSFMGILAFALLIFLASNGMALDGGQYPPYGTPYLPDGSPYLPDGSPYNPDGSPYLPDGSPYLPDGSPYLPDGTPYLPDGTPYLPDGSPYLPDGGSGQGEHPATGPVGSAPASAPSESSTGALNYGQGQELTQRDLQLAGGGLSAYMAVSGLQLLVRYNGAWTTGPAAIRYWGSTSTVTQNDQPQYIWSWELYPNGRQVWKGWGYRWGGYIHGIFTGDMRGWHQLAMWGSRSAWSNSVWIYVR
jgi:hypothetical protein